MTAEMPKKDMSLPDTDSVANNNDTQVQVDLSEKQYLPGSNTDSSSVHDPVAQVLIKNLDTSLQDLQSCKPSELSSQTSKVQNPKYLTTSVPITQYKSSPSTRGSPTRAPLSTGSDRRGVQGILVRFFRNGDAYHAGVQMAINEVEFKSWEAFLNYLNRQKNLSLPTGAIQYVYSINGQQIRSINKFQHRQSYIVASGMFTKTSYRHMNEPSADDSDVTINEIKQLRELKPWRSLSTNGEQLCILPYARLNIYETMTLDRSITKPFERWLSEEVTDLLSRYIQKNVITHLYGITKYAFIEMRSFSHLFKTIKITDRFIACTTEEFPHSKRYLSTVKPNSFLISAVRPMRSFHELQKLIPSQEVNVSINWIYGYDGTKEKSKSLYAVSDHEVLYIIGSICILYETDLKKQRFYTKHNNPITCVAVHQCHSLVASSEAFLLKDRLQTSIHIWDHKKLEMVRELRKDRFGSYIRLLSFSPKPDNNFMLLSFHDKPTIILIIDWKCNEIIHSITTKSDKILSAMFVFNTNEWIVCVSQQYLSFYKIRWDSKPVQTAIQRESEVQNIYTGAVACDLAGEKLIVGDKIGSIHVWCLVENEPKLMTIKENLLENEIEMIIPVNQDAFLFANVNNQIKLWNFKYNSIQYISWQNDFGSIQSICAIRRGLAIGTKLNYIIITEFYIEKVDILMHGHTSPPICLCSNRSSENFFSVSSDRHIFKWNNQTRLIEWSIKSSQLISCATLHPTRNIIVLGTETSKLLVYDTLSSCYITTILLNANASIKAVRFSPDGGNLAAGLQNGLICIYDVFGNGDFTLRAEETRQNNSAPIVDIFWSVDSSHLLSIYSDNNYNIMLVPSLDIVRERNINYISWHQMTHPISCQMIDKSLAEQQVSTIHVSSDIVLCCGKDGKIRLIQNCSRDTIQTLPIGFPSVQSMIPSANKNLYLLLINDDPIIAEVEITVESC